MSGSNVKSQQDSRQPLRKYKLVFIGEQGGRDSFNAIDKWVKEVKDNRKNPMIVIMGNKCDLEKDRVISTEEAEKKAESHGATYHEASAKLGTNINHIFRKIASDLPLDDGSAPKNSSRNNEYDIRLESSPKDESGYSCLRVCGG